MKTYLHLFAIVFCLICIEKTFAKDVFFLKDFQREYILDGYVELLVDRDGIIQTNSILSGQLDQDFKKVQSIRLAIQPGITYWGKIHLQNQLQGELSDEWILSFGSEDISYLDLYSHKSGQWIEYPNGGFHGGTNSLNPTKKINDFLVRLPNQSNQVIYFRLLDHSNLAKHHLKISLSPLIPRIQQINWNRYLSVFVMGALTIMMIYNIILNYRLQERMYWFYSLYLASMLLYNFHGAISYPINGIEQWLFGQAPKFRYYIRINYYLVVISYLGFIRTFLDLKSLLPKWNDYFKGLTYLGIFFFFLDGGLLYLTNFNLSYSNTIVGLYVLGTSFSTLYFLIPLYRSGSTQRNLHYCRRHGNGLWRVFCRSQFIER